MKYSGTSFGMLRRTTRYFPEIPSHTPQFDTCRNLGCASGIRVEIGFLQQGDWSGMLPDRVQVIQELDDSDD